MVIGEGENELSEGPDDDMNDPEGDENTSRKVDRYLDSVLGRFMGRARKSQEIYQDVAPKIKSRVVSVAKEGAETLKSLDERGDEFTGKIRISKFTDWLISPLIKYPRFTLLFVITMALICSSGILNIQGNIRGDMEVYLPLDEEITDVIEEVREDWTIDILMLYVETNNVNDQTDETNITDVKVLREMSRIEYTLDPHTDDKGANDDVIYVLSISTLIKEMNSTPPRLMNEVINELIPSGLENPGLQFVPGDYEIPQDQDLVDSIFDQLPTSSMGALIADTNDDNTYDSSIIIVGLAKGADHEEFMKKVDREIGDTKFCKITATGPIPATQVLTERTYDEMTTVVPFAILFIGISLFLFHRNWKILVIEGVPLVSELIITFGIIGLLNLELTPQVVLVAPIIAALGVANGLYITNKYTEESHIKDKKLRMRITIHSTAKPIMLAAITTAFGFASLIAINMRPMKILGVGLALGIAVDFIVTFLTVPALILLLRYEKKVKIHKEGRFARIPANHSKKILLVVGLLVVASLVMYIHPGVEANMDYMKMSPRDEPVIIKMEESTEKFGGGQINLFLVRGRPAMDKDEDGKIDKFEAQSSLKDIELLDNLDDLETNINGDPKDPTNPGIENSIAIGITDIMKSIRVPNATNIEQVEMLFDQYPLIEEFYYTFFDSNFTFWDILHSTNIDDESRTSLINIFYNTITYEMRGMLVNEDFSRTVVYVTMPNMDTVDTERTVNEVDDALREIRVGDSTSVLTGFGPTVVTVNNLLVKSSLTSTAMAIVLVFILLIIAFRSFKYTIFTVIPIIFVVALQPLTFFYIEYLGKFLTAMPWIPPQEFAGDLNLFSAMLGSIIIGLGIDFAIHMTETIREKGTTLRAVTHGVSTTGRSFIETTITMIAGIMAIFFVNIVSVREFIVLIILLLVYSMVAGLIVLPALFAFYIRSRTEAKLLREAALEEEKPIV